LQGNRLLSPSLLLISPFKITKNYLSPYRNDIGKVKAKENPYYPFCKSTVLAIYSYTKRLVNILGKDYRATSRFLVLLERDLIEKLDEKQTINPPLTFKNLGELLREVGFQQPKK